MKSFLYAIKIFFSIFFLFSDNEMYPLSARALNSPYYNPKTPYILIYNIKF
jgi:hypothetical protein